jgi:hypothetical protein
MSGNYASYDVLNSYTGTSVILLALDEVIHNTQSISSVRRSDTPTLPKRENSEKDYSPGEIFVQVLIYLDYMIM